MNPPPTIQIGPYAYTIERTHDETLKAGDTWGDHDIGEQRIRVRTDASPDCSRDTVLHEILHAICEVYGVRPRKEERLVRQLSPAILDVFDRNPELLDYLFGYDGPETEEHH